LIFTSGKPVCEPVPFVAGVVELGRHHVAFAAPDPRLSKRHARVEIDGRGFQVTDLESRNGTFVDGQRVAAGRPTRLTRGLRIGDSLFVPRRDLHGLAVRVSESHVEGRALQDALAAAGRAAAAGAILHICGESGVGKERVASAFHEAGRGSAGRLVPVNCAAIPEPVAERLLFGAKRGAYSGADADAEGYLQAAHTGTLFLDEIAELSPAVQAKLLRVLETGELLPLGASQPRHVDLRFCSATHRDLRALVTAGKLREDLYYRVATPRVVVPPLRERPEEIPWLLAAEVARVSPGLKVHVSLVEACLLRPWPGNLRELLAEARAAAQEALASSSPRVEARHLGKTAGALLGEAAPAPPPPPPRGRRARIEEALRAARGNVSAAARALAMHRNQLRRWLAENGVDPRSYGDED
jgi:DNA-binding NtrC family response regulator